MLYGDDSIYGDIGSYLVRILHELKRFMAKASRWIMESIMDSTLCTARDYLCNIRNVPK